MQDAIPFAWTWGRRYDVAGVTMSSTTSASLLEQARDLTSPAWRRLVALVTPVLHAWLASAGVQPADRDDLTQRVLEVLVRKLPEFQHNGRTGAFRAWLRATLTNLLREHWRDGTTPAGASVLDQLADDNAALSRLWDEQHDRHVLRGLLDQVRGEFAPSTWQAFQATALEGVAPREAAATLGLSVNAILIARSRVLARLRTLARDLVE
jgi:RNA polymerase sigma-70 factor (ECF subfamily)